MACPLRRSVLRAVVLLLPLAAAALAAARPVASCAEATSSGLYVLHSGEGVHCEASVSGGGWTLAAVVATSGTAWRYDASDGNSGQLSSAWENEEVFGSADDLSSDYKGSAFFQAREGPIMITFNGQHLLTTESCKPQFSLREVFNTLKFNANWSQADPRHSCNVASYTNNASERVLVNVWHVSTVFLKYGEAEGAEENNKDRVYLSTNLRQNVHSCRGLGAYSQMGPPWASRFCLATETWCEASVNVGISSDFATTEEPGAFYGIYVRTAATSSSASPSGPAAATTAAAAVLATIPATVTSASPAAAASSTSEASQPAAVLATAPPAELEPELAGAQRCGSSTLVAAGLVAVAAAVGA